MQFLLSRFAFTFADDAMALINGTVRMASDLVRDGLSVVRARMTAPVDAIARACDVAGVLRPHGTARRLDRRTTLAMADRKRSGSVFSALRGLGNLS